MSVFLLWQKLLNIENINSLTGSTLKGYKTSNLITTKLKSYTWNYSYILVFKIKLNLDITDYNSRMYATSK